MNQKDFAKLEQVPTSVLKEISITELDKELGGETTATATPPTPTAPPPQQQAPTVAPTPTNGTAQAQPFLNGPTQTVNLAQLLTGETPVRLLDSLAPPVLAIALKTFTNRDIPKKVFAMSADERKTVEPVLNEALKHLNINFNNPFVALAVSLGAVYGGKILTVISELERFDKIEREEPQQEKAKPQARPKADGETRGRHKKDCECETCVNKRGGK